MTPEEIKNSDRNIHANTADGTVVGYWLQEIAYQLARINERADKGEVEVTVHQP